MSPNIGQLLIKDNSSARLTFHTRRGGTAERVHLDIKLGQNTVEALRALEP
jgi:hypothetical protein